jgi:hypothetical protein
LLAMDVNDNAGNLAPRGVLGFFASELAPTSWPSVGASLLAMDVNDNAGNLAPRAFSGFSRASSYKLAFCRSELARDGRQR